MESLLPLFIGYGSISVLSHGSTVQLILPAAPQFITFQNLKKVQVKLFEAPTSNSHSGTLKAFL